MILRARTPGTIRLASALSIALHAAALVWGWAAPVRLPLESAKQAEPGRSLALRLAPRPLPGPPPAAAAAPPPLASQARRRLFAAKDASRPPVPPPVLALDSPAPSIPPPPPAERASPPAAARAPASEDFAAAVAARQRAREAMTAPAAAPAPTARVETEQERHNRIAAANLGLDRTPTFGDRPHGGGMFQVQSVTSDEAQLLFFGWNKDIRRNAYQTLNVRRGGHSSIQIALVRRMIAIIREHESGDFLWESRRLGRYLTLSARVADNAGLEDVLMQEFFPEHASRR